MSGSLPIGLLISWLLVLLAANSHLVAALILPLYYLADASLTLLRRVAGREDVLAGAPHPFLPALPQTAASASARSSPMCLQQMSCWSRSPRRAYVVARAVERRDGGFSAARRWSDNCCIASRRGKSVSILVTGASGFRLP